MKVVTMKLSSRDRQPTNLSYIILVMILLLTLSNFYVANTDSNEYYFYNNNNNNKNYIYYFTTDAFVCKVTHLTTKTTASRTRLSLSTAVPTIPVTTSVVPSPLSKPQLPPTAPTRSNHPLPQQSTRTGLLSWLRKFFGRRRLDQDQEIPPTKYFTQVVSDVDDTLKSSGGIHIFDIALGGIDTQYPRNTIYPGVAEFMLQLSLGPRHRPKSSADSSSFTPMIIPKVAILTARAYELKAFLEIKETNPLAVLFRQTARQYYNMTNDWGFAPILYGSIVEWIVQDRKGLRKFHNFEQLLSLQQQQNQSSSLPKIVLNYIYVGDTGEYDEEAGMAMLQYYPEYVPAVFLHVVTDNETAIRTNTVAIPSTKYIHGRPILYFRTYVGAAVAAYEHGLISQCGLQYVVDEVSSLLRSTNQSTISTAVKFTRDQQIDLEDDLHRANQLLIAI